MGEPEKREFQAEVKQLLELMVHSLYSNKDIFLRELVSNASDALDKLRFEGITKPELLPGEELRIVIHADPKERRLRVDDNGIGMSREELVANLGTVARSGTRQFLDGLKAHQGAELPPELIGQFGVGFYSSFMVARRIEVLTRRAGEAEAWRWVSEGDGSFTVEEATRPEPGTTVTLELREPDEEDGLQDHAQPGTVRSIVKRYSDFVAYPIQLIVAGEERAEDAEEGATDEPEVLNSRKAIWTRPFDEISDEEHAEFYKHVAHDWSDPLTIIKAKIEGTLEARALLYLPSQAPIDLYWREQARRGVHLYVKRVFIMDDCQELLPEYLRFVRGVVDAEDLSLNVSREMLQQDRQVRAIRNFLVKKVLDHLKGLMEAEPDKYRKLWSEFGPVLKEGLAPMQEQRERVLSLALFASTRDESEPTSLADYVSRMPEGQDAIYHATGASRGAVARSPHLEAFLEKGREVLLLSDPIDEIWTQGAPEFEGRKLRSVGSGDVEPAGEEEREEEEKARAEKSGELAPLLSRLAELLEEQVKDVRLSSRLRSSPACLVGETGDPSPAIEDMLRRLGQDVPRTKRVLELNPEHPLVARLQEVARRDREDPLLADSAQLLHGQALLAEGGKLEDPVAFARLVTSVMVRALGEGSPAESEDEGA